MTDETYYKCDRCGEGFSLEESDTIYEDGQPVTACPNCRSANIEEGEKCNRCGEIVYPWNIRGGVCPDCFTECVLEYRQKLDELDDIVIEVLTDVFGEIDITRR